MFIQTFSSLHRLRSWPWLHRRFKRLSVRTVFVAVALVVFYLTVVPQLLKLRFRAGLSWYDLGIYGFGPSQGYVSYGERSPVVEISPPEANCDSRYTFLAPRGDSVAHPGPVILDSRGELVWMKHNWGTTQDFKVQRYRGEEYLTFWQGDEENGHGRGSWYMVRFFIYKGLS
jgi:hypothetical protein